MLLPHGIGWGLSFAAAAGVVGLAAEAVLPGVAALEEAVAL